MKKYMTTVRDDVAENYFGCFDNVNRATAIRSFEESLKVIVNQLHARPSDLSLYHIGFFDDSTGVFEAVSPTKICDGRIDIE